VSGEISWIRRQLVALRRWIWPLKAQEVEDLPDELSEDHIYLVGDDGLWWSAAMKCPCGCQATIQLSLVPNDRPRWRAQVAESGIISLFPSVWRTKGCGSHFVVYNGRIRWARSARETECDEGGVRHAPGVSRK
jgi:hypothetical protein